MIKRTLKRVANACGFLVARKSQFYADIFSESDFMNLYEQCNGFSLKTIERMYSLYIATKYIIQHRIPGDFVECGVWRGGSAMLCALTLKMNGDEKRRIYLYDTFEGMTRPTERDLDFRGRPAHKHWAMRRRGSYNEWCYASIEQVTANMRSTGYPMTNVVFVKGCVEKTIPDVLPDKVAFLQLDTDWYESTYHELTHLFPLLAERGGVLFVGDFGHWKGAREAVDRYFCERNVQMMLTRIDYTGRLGIRM